MKLMQWGNRVKCLVWVLQNALYLWGESHPLPPPEAIPFDFRAFFRALGRLGGLRLAASCGLVLAA